MFPSTNVQEGPELAGVQRRVQSLSLPGSKCWHSCISRIHIYMHDASIVSLHMCRCQEALEEDPTILSAEGLPRCVTLANFSYQFIIELIGTRAKGTTAMHGSCILTLVFVRAHSFPTLASLAQYAVIAVSSVITFTFSKSHAFLS